MYNYHDKIRRIREAKDYKQEFMAAKLNISQRLIVVLRMDKRNLL